MLALPRMERHRLDYMSNKTKLTNTIGITDPPGNAPPSEQPPGFLTLQQLRPHIPMCERTLRHHIKEGSIPSIQLPGSRRLLFDLRSVLAALLRFQRGGI